MQDKKKRTLSAYGFVKKFIHSLKNGLLKRNICMAALDARFNIDLKVQVCDATKV